MNQAFKATILSLFVFPGAGYFYLKKNIMGFVITVIVLGCLAVLFSSIFSIAQTIAEQILYGQINADISSITSEIHSQLNAIDSTAINRATWLMVLCWVFSAIDCYRIGTKMKTDKAMLVKSP